MIGRALGVGVRVAGRIAEQWLAGAAQPAADPPGAHRSAPVRGSVAPHCAPGPAAASAAPQTLKPANRAVGGFLRPFRRVGGILWLEITGVFFLLPVVVFAPALWRAAAAYRHTSDHRTLWVTASVIAVFLYLGVSSFWRAHRRSQRP